MRRKWIYVVPAAIVGILLFGLIGGQLVLHLWNWLLPPIFGWRVITFWQALGLLALCRILFGRSGWHRAGRSHFRQRMRERWDHMTSEEREKVRHGMRGACGHSGAPAAEPKA